MAPRHAPGANIHPIIILLTPSFIFDCVGVDGTYTENNMRCCNLLYPLQPPNAPLNVNVKMILETAILRSHLGVCCVGLCFGAIFASFAPRPKTSPQGWEEDAKRQKTNQTGQQTNKQTKSRIQGIKQMSAKRLKIAGHPL